MSWGSALCQYLSQIHSRSNLDKITQDRDSLQDNRPSSRELSTGAASLVQDRPHNSHVGLGVGITAFASMMQDFIAAKPWSAARDTGRMIALVGDAEMDEGNIFECLQEGWKHNLRNTW